MGKIVILFCLIAFVCTTALAQHRYGQRGGYGGRYPGEFGRGYQGGFGRQPYLGVVFGIGFGGRPRGGHRYGQYGGNYGGYQQYRY